MGLFTVYSNGPQQLMNNIYVYAPDSQLNSILLSEKQWRRYRCFPT